MTKIKPKQIQIVYALGANAGLVEHGNKDDELHIIVERITGKTSVKELSQKDFKAVVDELHNYLGKVDLMTKDQQRLAWRYIYRLIELDKSENKATAGNRMVGAIGKILDIKVEDITKPFKDITKADGQKLIEQLKRYVLSEERKNKK